MENGVWDIVPRLEDKFLVTSKWIYKIKHVLDGIIDKYKEIFVARGFSQQEALMGWNIHQMDVKTAFLNGTIDEEVYIE